MVCVQFVFGKISLALIITTLLLYCTNPAIPAFGCKILINYFFFFPSFDDDICSILILERLSRVPWPL